MMMGPWIQPAERYYYGWYGGEAQPVEPTDGDIKSVVVDRLRENPHTKDCDIKVAEPLSVRCGRRRWHGAPARR